MPRSTTDSGVHSVGELFARREGPGRALALDAGAVAFACHAIAARLHRGGKLLVFGMGTAATDAQHIAVEFVHPVIMGKRSLPALSLTNDVATVTGLLADGGAEVFAHQVTHLGRPEDVALGVSTDGRCAAVRRGLEVAHERGLLTVALVGDDSGPTGTDSIADSPDVDHALPARSDDPRVVKEVHVTIYHVLWELVHVFLEQPGLLAPEVIR